MPGKKILFSGAAAAGAAALLALGGVAHASVGPPSFTPAGANSVAGYYAHALDDTINFTDLTSYVGSDGSHTLEQLPVSVISSSSGGSSIGGAAGIALCNQSTGKAAQLGVVNDGDGTVSVVYATGTFGAAVSNGDKCQNGIVNPAGLKTGYAHFGVLAAAIPDNNTNSLRIEYDPRDNFSFGGHHFTAGTVVFAETNLGAPGVSHVTSVNIHGYGVTFNEADAHVFADTQHVVPLPGTMPYPYAGHNSDPGLLAGFSHTQWSGNSVVPGGTEVAGSFYSSNVVTAFPVGAAKNGKVYEGVTKFVNDGFLALVGAPVS